jgi:hypothetical protein
MEKVKKKGNRKKKIQKQTEKRKNKNNVPGLSRK